MVSRVLKEVCGFFNFFKLLVSVTSETATSDIFAFVSYSGRDKYFFGQSKSVLHKVSNIIPVNQNLKLTLPYSLLRESEISQ